MEEKITITFKNKEYKITEAQAKSIGLPLGRVNVSHIVPGAKLKFLDNDLFIIIQYGNEDKYFLAGACSSQYKLWTDTNSSPLGHTKLELVEKLNRLNAIPV